MFFEDISPWLPPPFQLFQPCECSPRDSMGSRSWWHESPLENWLTFHNQDTSQYTHIMSVQSTRHQVCCRDNFDLQLYEWEHVVRFSEISTPPLLSEICPGFFFSQWSALFDWSQRSQCYFLSGTFEQNRQWRTCCWKLPPAKSYICNFLSRELIWYQTLLPLLTSFSSASSSASVLWCAATRKNFWIQK